MTLARSAQNMFFGDPKAVFQIIHEPMFVIRSRLTHWSACNIECDVKGTFFRHGHLQMLG